MYTMSVDRKKRKPRVPRKTELGAFLRSKRESENWDIRKGAELIGIEPGSLSDLENGLRRPNFETLVGIHRGYGADLDELVRMAARDAKLELPSVEAIRNRATSLAGRAGAFPDLAKILDRLAVANPKEYRAFLLMLEFAERQSEQDDVSQASYRASEPGHEEGLP
jgi:transcriptional regulator with XRE-family HTH domain